MFCVLLVLVVVAIHAATAVAMAVAMTQRQRVCGVVVAPGCESNTVLPRMASSRADAAVIN